jgi:hypothetical protein
MPRAPFAPARLLFATTRTSLLGLQTKSKRCALQSEHFAIFECSGGSCTRGPNRDCGNPTCAASEPSVSRPQRGTLRGAIHRENGNARVRGRGAELESGKGKARCRATSTSVATVTESVTLNGVTLVQTGVCTSSADRASKVQFNPGGVGVCSEGRGRPKESLSTRALQLDLQAIQRLPCSWSTTVRRSPTLAGKASQTNMSATPAFPSFWALRRPTAGSGTPEVFAGYRRRPRALSARRNGAALRVLGTLAG